MKFLHLSDLHLGKRLNAFSLLEDQQYMLSQLCDIVEREQTDAVILAGDIYNKAVPSAEAAAPATQRARTARRLSRTMAP